MDFLFEASPGIIGLIVAAIAYVVLRYYVKNSDPYGIQASLNERRIARKHRSKAAVKGWETRRGR